MKTRKLGKTGPRPDDGYHVKRLFNQKGRLVWLQSVRRAFKSGAAPACGVASSTILDEERA
jgi:hypothetical protein